MSTNSIVHYVDSWPIVVSKIHGKDHSEQALRSAYATWTGLMQRGQHVLILDMTEGNAGSTAAQRARVAEWIAENESLLRTRQLANVLVFDSVVVRGIVTAVFWLRPPVNAHFAARNLDEAVDYALARLKEAGVGISPERVALARSAGKSASNLKRADG